MIQSGTTPERLLRTTIVTLLVCGYSGWSLWDGYIAYPRANVESALRNKIGAVIPKTLPASDRQLTADRASGGQAGEPFSAVVARLGQPSFRHKGFAYYFGHGGFLSIELAGDRVVNHQWAPGPQFRPIDLAIQKAIGFALLPVGLAFMIHLIRVITTRATLTDTGLKVQGRPLIPYDAMTDLGSVAGKTGCFDLRYTGDGRSKVLHLDEYALRQVRAIVREICSRKGFALPQDAMNDPPEYVPPESLSP